MAFFDMFAKDEREEKLKREISSLEFRKGTIISSIDAEIASLKAEQEKCFFDAGRYAYEIWCKEKTQADLTFCWNKVQGIVDKITVQETKKKEMIERYDEEIKLMTANFNVTMNNIPSSNSLNSATCQHCGASISCEDVFCQACGGRVKG